MLEFLRHWRYGNQYGYEKYFRQNDRKPVGKPGIILADLGMPEDFDAGFYTKFMDHVFTYSLPGFLQPVILADRGIALLDPVNPLARVFTEGKTTGIYSGCPVGPYRSSVVEAVAESVSEILENSK